MWRLAVSALFSSTTSVVTQTMTMPRQLWHHHVRVGYYSFVDSDYALNAYVWSGMNEANTTNRNLRCT